MEQLENTESFQESSVDTATQPDSATTTQQETITHYDGEKLSDKIARDPNAISNLTPQELTDLDKLEKFKYGGKIYTKDEFKKGWMMHSDYTKKTQAYAEEKKQAEEFKKYAKNYYYDVEKVKANPSLVEEFKKIYPEEFHEYVKQFEEKKEIESNNNQRQSDQESHKQEYKDPRVDEMYGFYKTETKRATGIEVDSNFKVNLQKYPSASEPEVVAMLRAMIDEKKEINSETYEQLFRQSHEKIENLIKQRQSQMFKSQKEANEKAKDSAKGGGTLGQAPRQPRSIKEASEMLLQSNELV